MILTYAPIFGKQIVLLEEDSNRTESVRIRKNHRLLFIPIIPSILSTLIQTDLCKGYVASGTVLLLLLDVTAHFKEAV